MAVDAPEAGPGPRSLAAGEAAAAAAKIPKRRTAEPPAEPSPSETESRAIDSFLAQKNPWADERPRERWEQAPWDVSADLYAAILPKGLKPVEECPLYDVKNQIPMPVRSAVLRHWWMCHWCRKARHHHTRCPNFLAKRARGDKGKGAAAAADGSQ